MEFDPEHKALITGCGGQDGSYMAELLLSKGYQVHGVLRPSGNRNFWQLNKAVKNPRFFVIWSDITDPGLFYRLALDDYTDVYHFGAVSHVKTSFDDPALTINTNTIATANLLEAFQRYSPKTKIYLAVSSEMYANQTGTDKLDTRSPYGVSKVGAYMLGKIYRDQGMFVVNGIAYNHESRRRGVNFVTRKIGLSLLKTGQVTLGNLDAKRDWHHAKDFVEGAYLAMQYKTPEDFVFASGISHTVKEFAVKACDIFGLSPETSIFTDKKCERPLDVLYLEGNPSKAQRLLRWRRKYSFDDIVVDCCQAPEEETELKL